jgi:hypothetical protein
MGGAPEETKWPMNGPAIGPMNGPTNAAKKGPISRPKLNEFS